MFGNNSLLASQVSLFRSFCVANVFKWCFLLLRVWILPSEPCLHDIRPQVPWQEEWTQYMNWENNVTNNKHSFHRGSGTVWEGEPLFNCKIIYKGSLLQCLSGSVFWFIFFLPKQYKLNWLKTLCDRRMPWITNNCHVLPQESLSDASLTTAIPMMTNTS